MAKERLKSPRLRLFTALELPDQVLDRLAAVQRQLLELGSGELRAAPREQLHVTLAFLGHRYERDLAAIEAAVAGVELAPVELAFHAELTPKPARRPRLYAATLEPHEALRSLRADLVARLSEQAAFEDEAREFWPHATLCRVKRRVKRHDAIEPLPSSAIPAGAATALTLFRSDLEATGAVHKPLLRRPLPGSA